MSHSPVANQAYGAIPSISAIAGGTPGTMLGGGYQIGVAHEFDAGIDLRITPAHGGFIVSVNHRGSHTVPELHIVTEDKDIGSEIGKIITMSCLKKDNK